MRALDAKEIESSFKINLKDVSWCMSIKEDYRPRALVIARLSKEGNISLIIRGRPSFVTRKYD